MESYSADKGLNLKPWEERYERIWVENEKRELKTNFKDITAEMKQLFGKNEAGKIASLVEEVAADGFGEEWKSSPIISSPVTESTFKKNTFFLGRGKIYFEINLNILKDVLIFL